MSDYNGDQGHRGSDLVGPLISGKRQELVRSAVDAWRKKLLDLGGNNRLIYYRPLQVGTFNLKGADPDTVERLLSGDEVSLSKLFPIPKPVKLSANCSPSQSPSNLFHIPKPVNRSASSQHEAEEKERERDEARRILADATKRAKAIHATGRVNVEERGIQTLHLAFGTATWDTQGATMAKPNAPILLRPLRVTPTGGRQRDFKFQLDGDWEVSQTLLLFWSETFRLNLDECGLAGARLGEHVDDHQDDPRWLINHVRNTVEEAGVVPGLETTLDCFAGNFSYTNLPMVHDLKSNIDKLAANDLIAAIAGDSDAANAVRKNNSLHDISPTLPDTVLPTDEYLVVDADSSQSQVLNAAQAGRSLIVEGPPGTGKSQTIANLIAGLAARGKSVLFVAEKRAAIEAVKKRLERPGLRGDAVVVDLSVLTLDLHTITSRKKEVAAALARSLETLESATLPNLEFVHVQLKSTRDRLVDYKDQLHMKREPYGLSSFEINELILKVADVGTVQLGPGALDAYEAKWVVGAQVAAEQWVATYRRIDWDSRWAKVEIVSQDKAKELESAARRLQAALPTFSQALDTISHSLNFKWTDLSLGKLQDFSDLFTDAVDIASPSNGELWKLDVEELSTAFAERGRIKCFDRRLRAARKALRSVLIEKLDFEAQHQLVDKAQQAKRRSTELGADLTVDLTPARAFSSTIKPIATDSDLLAGVLGGEPRHLLLSEISEGVNELVQTSENAHFKAQLRDQCKALVSMGMEPIVRALESGELSGDTIGAAVSGSIWQAVKDAIERPNPVLNSFDGDLHSSTVAEFSRQDLQHLRSGAGRVLRAVAELAIVVRNKFPNESAVIEREAKKSRSHQTLSDLLEQAGPVLVALRPCWMMSPLMVAQALPATALFDYVVFDEASQIRPEEAISALLRGRNVIIAGDPHQLPPSAFFAGAMKRDESVDEYDEDAHGALVHGYESILDVASALLPHRMLTWHYRSEDDRLIKLSNDCIYNRTLKTFPSCNRDSPVRFVRVHHEPENASEVRSNRTEVENVVDLMFDHAAERPDESLGVIAFGQPHATAIHEELLRRLEGRGADVVAYFDEDRFERVFVKNIERVQGDERDAIILSVGYGKDTAGKVPMRFGPVNQEGGERRINVAASRARRRMTIVSSIGQADFDPSDLGKGPRLLQSLLKFAESGGTDTGEAGSATPTNPFELAVKYELDLLGLNPIPQYGVGSYRLDFALPHPDDRSKMVLAVEADGASYHSSPTARDRDRLRQQVLEAKGWVFHRIWSTDFFHDRKRAAHHVKEAYDAALRGDPPPLKASADKDGISTQSQPGPELRRPHLRKGLPITDYHHEQLVELARYVTEGGEALITDEDAKERMKVELGFSRRGRLIEEAFDRALATARRTRSVPQEQ